MRNKKDIIDMVLTYCLIIIPIAILYYINTYYIGLGIVYFGFGIGGLIFIGMFLSDVKSGVAIFPILLIAGIGYGVMQLGDEEKGIIQDRSTPLPLVVTDIPKAK